MKESPIFIKTYEILIWLLEHTIKFPKHQRFVMAKRMEDAALEFYDSLIKAIKTKEKEEQLRIADFHLERLKNYNRLCKDLRLLSLKQYEYMAIKLNEIGNLLGGWQKRISRDT